MPASCSGHRAAPGRRPTSRWRRRRPCGSRGRRHRRAADRRRRRQRRPLHVQVDAGHPRLRRERDERRVLRRQLAPAQAVLLLRQHDDRAALRRLVRQRRQLRRVGQRRLADARQRNELGRLAVAERDRAGLVEQQRVDVAGGFDRPAGHRQHVVLHQPVHAGDADRRQQAADRRRDQADEQRDQHEQRLRRARVDRERLQRDDGDQEDDRQPGQQDVERDLVRRLLPLGPFDERDHPVEERLARIGRDLHPDPVGQHLRAAGHRGAVAARLADDRRRLAGDGALVDRRDAFDDLAVGRESPRRPRPGRCRPCGAPAPARPRSVPSGRSRLATVSVLARRSVSACALPRPSAIASAKLAKSTVSQSQNVICSSKPSPPPPVAASLDRGAASSARCRSRRRTSPGSAPSCADGACGTSRRSRAARSADPRSTCAVCGH